MSESDRSETKYGSSIADHEWSDPEPETEPMSRTKVKNHKIDVIYTTDPGEDGGYGREKYTATIMYNDETGEPYVLYVVEHRWKGNYWRDVTDWDWRDVPGPVRQQVADVLPVESPNELDSGVRMMDEGGESRWEKHHKHRVEELSGDEMWGTSFLRDALDSAETAAESFDEGSKGEELAERLVSVTQNIIETVDIRSRASESQQEGSK